MSPELHHSRRHRPLRERFAGRAAQNHFRVREGLHLSSIGIGTYLGNPDEATDARYKTPSCVPFSSA